MIISHKYKCIFVKTKKTAGTSIEVFLSQCCGEKDIVTPINPYVERHVARNYKGIWNLLSELIENKDRSLQGILREIRKKNKFYNHIPARIIKSKIPNRIWNKYYKFCIERNPWDKTLSHYYMLKYRSMSDLTIKQYFKKRKFCLNYPFYTNVNGDLIVDRVIKYESLIDELNEVFDMLGIAFNGTLGVKAKSEFRNDRISYKDVFTNKQRRIVEKVFDKEIEMHGYTY